MWDQIYSGSIFGPDFQTKHPVRIEAIQTATDANPVTPIIGQGGVVQDRITEQVRISWTKLKGAKTYNLYGSLSPINKNNILQEGITGLETTFIIPVFTQALQYYFWVAGVDVNGKVTYLTQDPATLATRLSKDAFHPNPLTPDCRWLIDTNPLNCEMEKDLQYIRAGHRLQLEMGGEKAILFKRRHAEDRPWGIPCTCTQSFERETDPDYQASGRCKLCFGTGIFGGFYPGIPILFRYASMPSDKFTKETRGFQLEHKVDSWTLWEPFIGIDDLLLRVTDGTRFIVTDRSESSIRGIRMHQRFSLKEIEKTNILEQVTDQAIDQALTRAKVPGYSVSLFKVFG
jgi:hypothetical protein